MLHDGELRKPGGLEVAGITFVLHLCPTQKLGRVQKPLKSPHYKCSGLLRSTEKMFIKTTHEEAAVLGPSHLTPPPC